MSFRLLLIGISLTLSSAVASADYWSYVVSDVVHVVNYDGGGITVSGNVVAWKFGPPPVLVKAKKVLNNYRISILGLNANMQCANYAATAVGTAGTFVVSTLPDVDTPINSVAATVTIPVKDVRTCEVKRD